MERPQSSQGVMEKDINGKENQDQKLGTFNGTDMEGKLMIKFHRGAQANQR